MDKLTILTVLCIAVTVTSASGSEFDLHSSEWAEFKQTYAKVYSNRPEEINRAIIFFRNKRLIDEFNANNSSSYKLAINHLADRTQVEYKARLGYSGNISSSNSDIGAAFLQEVLGRPMDVPNSVDWRQVPGRVTEVKNEETCDASFAFAAAGALEGQELSVTGRKELVSLSAQNIIDCSSMDQGCLGGYPAHAFEMISSEGGIESEQSYPYEKLEGKCRFDKTKSVMTTKGSSYLKEGDEEMLKQVVAKFGPVSAVVYAAYDFGHYTSGVYRRPQCSRSKLYVNHPVLVVGYGSDPKGGDYWIIKNVFGKTWGESGYMRIARNADNMCGIATLAAIPVV